MGGRLGPRFALEATFLILLAVALGIADVDWRGVVVVMGAGWVLVSLIELVASRRAPWPPPAPPPPGVPAPVLEETQEEPAPEEPRRPRRWLGLRRREDEAAEPEPELPPVPELEPEPVAAAAAAEREEVVVEPPERELVEPVAMAETGPRSADEPGIEPEREPETAAEPLAQPVDELTPEAENEQPRRRRRWFGLRRAKELPLAPSAEQTDEFRIPEPPKHVRKLEPGERVGHDDEPAEARAGFEREEE
jgi:hypothetical protein